MYKIKKKHISIIKYYIEICDTLRIICQIFYKNIKRILDFVNVK